MARRGTIACQLYASAFSGEVVYAVRTTEGETFEGVAPRGYVESEAELSGRPVPGRVDVNVVSNGGDKAEVLTPDGELLSVPADTVRD